MASDADKKVALALLDEVEDRVKKRIGNQIGLPADPDRFDAKLSIFCEDMTKQCEMAEKKAPNEKEFIIRSNILKAQLYGNWDKPGGVRGNHKKAIQCYENALSLIGEDPEAEAQIRYRYALMSRVAVAGVGGGKEKAIENFQRVIDLVGTDSELGIECAKEMEKEKQKKGGCFIATAACGNEASLEVASLLHFRDTILCGSKLGEMLVRFYYNYSPPIAEAISKNIFLRKIILFCFIKPIASLYRAIAKPILF